MTQEPDLLISAGFSDAQLVRETNKVVAQFRKRGEEAQKAFQDATGRVTDTQAARAHARELDRLSKAYDPVYRAASRYEAEVKRLDRALDIGAVTQTQYTARVTDAARQMQQASVTVDALGQRASRAQLGVGGLDRGVQGAGQGIGRFRHQIQNSAFQLQDFVVQVQNGTAASVAFSQQAPQLLGGFGAVGAVLGLVAALAVPVGVALFNLIGTGEDLEEQAKELDKSLGELNQSLADYRSAVESASAPTDDLVEKYGRAAGAAQQLLQQMAQLAKLEAASTLRASATAIAESLGGIVDTLNRFEAAQTALAPEDFLNEGTAAARAAEAQIERLRDEYGLTVDQARQLRDILTDQAAASTPEEVAASMSRLAAFLSDANREAGYTNDNLIAAERNAVQGALAGLEFATALEGAEAAAAGVLGTVDLLPGAIDAATASAAALTRQLAAAIAASQSIPGTLGAPSLARFGNGEDITRRAGGLDLQEQQTFRYAWQEQLKAEEEARRKAESAANRKGRKTGSGRKGKEDSPFFENVERDLVGLERQLTLIGKTSEEVATAEARWAMLDETKKRGITVNEQLNGQIDAQAAQVGRLTAELERAEIQQQKFDQAIDGVADAMAGALMEGESLRDGLAQVFKQIAADILKSGIRSALASQFVGGFNPFGLIGSFLGGGDPLTRSLRGAGLPARALGGPVRAGQAYMVGEQGPEPFVPAENGRILSVRQAQERISGSGGGTASVPRIIINNNAPGVDVVQEFVSRDEVRLMITDGIGRASRASADNQYLGG